MGIADLKIHLAPKVIFEIVPGLPITNTIITMWLVMFILILIAGIARITMKFFPGGFQNFVEWAIDSLYSFVEGVVGENVKKHFPLFITFFFTILASNWLGILLGITAEFLGFLRAPTTDINFTIALSCIAFLYFEYYSIKTHGFLGYLGHFFNFKAVFKKGPLGLVDFFVGLLHIVSEVVRPVALSLRLFGNVFGGEIVLTVAFLIFAPFLPVPFMLFEVMIGLIQAFVFSFLFLTFTNLNSTHEEEEEEKKLVLDSAHA